MALFWPGFDVFKFREYFETRLTSYCLCCNLTFLGKSLKINDNQQDINDTDINGLHNFTNIF